MGIITAREILDKYEITVVSECDIDLDIELDEFGVAAVYDMIFEAIIKANVTIYPNEALK